MNKRSQHVWDDTTDTLSHYRDQAHDVYDEGRRRAGDLYGRSRRVSRDVYGEGRRRSSAAVDAVAGRRTSNTSPLIAGLGLGLVAGAGLLWGVSWLLNRPTAVAAGYDGQGSPGDRTHLNDDGSIRPPGDDSSQDSRQPAVGPAIALQEIPGPGEPAPTDTPSGEIIDLDPIGKERAAQ